MIEYLFSLVNILFETFIQTNDEYQLNLVVCEITSKLYKIVKTVLRILYTTMIKSLFRALKR